MWTEREVSTISPWYVAQAADETTDRKLPWLLWATLAVTCAGLVVSTAASRRLPTELREHLPIAPPGFVAKTPSSGAQLAGHTTTPGSGHTGGVRHRPDARPGVYYRGRFPELTGAFGARGTIVGPVSVTAVWAVEPRTPPRAPSR